MLAFRKKFMLDELTLYETEHWVWSLRPEQVTLGSGILSLKRNCLTFSNLRSEEAADLKNMVKIIENSLSELFHYDVINYLMLMMVDKQVHFHVIPRYEKIRIFDSWQCKDYSWPGPPELTKIGAIVELKNLKNHIRANLEYL